MFRRGKCFLFSLYDNYKFGISNDKKVMVLEGDTLKCFITLYNSSNSEKQKQKILWGFTLENLSSELPDLVTYFYAVYQSRHAT